MRSDSGVRLAVPLAIDARRLQDRPLGGVGRWLANLLPHLADGADIVLLTDSRRPPLSGPGERARTSLAESSLWAPGRAPEAVWLQMSAAWWLRGFTGVFHGTFNALPATWRGPAVVTIHDLAPVHHPEDFARARFKLMAWRAQLRRAVRQAGTVQTDSAFMRDSVIDTYHLDPDRVVVAPPGVDPLFTPDRRDQGRELAGRLGVEGDYVVAIGGAARRGLPVAIEAWSHARAAGARHTMVVVGPDVPEARPGLVHVGSLSDELWANLLAGASALCYPTRYEGFGMPALEAAASGVPVVCAPIGPLPEVLGPAAEWCPTPTVADVAAALTRLLMDDARHAELRAAGLARAAAAPTWAQSAQVLLAAYSRVAA